MNAGYEQTLASLLSAVPVLEMLGDPETTIAGIAYDSRQVQTGDLFVALVGAQSDGHRYLDSALSRGASALLVERAEGVGDRAPTAVVENSRAAMAAAAAAFHNHPSSKLTLVGVTGTNGKTTLTYLLEAMLGASGHNPARIGTTGMHHAGTEEALANTTPESLDLQRLLADLVRAGASHVVLEVSSHGLMTHRVDGCRFAARVFLNLSRDHLDFHGDMDAYFAAKQRLFTDFDAGTPVIHRGDPWGQRLVDATDGGLSFSSEADADVHPSSPPRHDGSGICLRLNSPAGPIAIDSTLLGAPNVENLMAAATTGVALGLSAERIGAGLSLPIKVPGRLQRISDPRGERTVLVDYAHTPEALRRTLGVARALCGARLAVVFGCGGARDLGKRPEMGRAACAADAIFLTSDNPRTEAPEAILDAIEQGIDPLDRAKVSREVDRATAIEAAIAWAREGDLVLVAGKGHETYQERAEGRVPFDDAAICRRALGALS